MTSPLTIAETPVSTPSIEYDHRHVAMDMDVKPEATIGQLLASSLRKVTTASFKGMAYGVGAAQHRLHRGLVTFNQQSESTRPTHPTSPAPPPPIHTVYICTRCVRERFRYGPLRITRNKTNHFRVCTCATPLHAEMECMYRAKRQERFSVGSTHQSQSCQNCPCFIRSCKTSCQK
jgi:hypothetical protein